MSTRLFDLSVSSLDVGGTKKISGRALPSLLPEAQPLAAAPSFTQIPEIQQILNLSGITPFLTAEYIPDLIYLFQTSGIEAVQLAISQADPSRPESIIFNNPLQERNKATLKIENELILNEPEVIERNDIQCECGARRIQVSPPIQMRSADEPATYFARCVACKRKWKFSAA